MRCIKRFVLPSLPLSSSLIPRTKDSAKFYYRYGFLDIAPSHQALYARF
jgi:hypothetical protein